MAISFQYRGRGFVFALFAFLCFFAIFFSPDVATAKDDRVNDDKAVAQCESGNAESCYALATAFSEADNRPRDYQQANIYWQKACNLGLASACTDYGFSLYSGFGQEANVEKSVEIYRKACAGNIAIGCADLYYILKQLLNVRMAEVESSKEDDDAHMSDNERMVKEAVDEAMESLMGPQIQAGFLGDNFTYIFNEVTYTQKKYKWLYLDECRKDMAMSCWVTLSAGESEFPYINGIDEEYAQWGIALLTPDCSQNNIRACKTLAEIYRRIYTGLLGDIKLRTTEEVLAFLQDDDGDAGYPELRTARGDALKVIIKSYGLWQEKCQQGHYLSCYEGGQFIYSAMSDLTPYYSREPLGIEQFPDAKSNLQLACDKKIEEACDYLEEIG